MRKTNKLTFKQKQEAVAELFKQFHRAKLKLYCLENTNFYPQLNIGMLHEKKSGYNASIDERLNQRIDDRDELERVVAAFEIVIQALSPESQLIITNEFVLQKNPEWWLEFYSRATYYRLKTRALEEILFYVNIS